MIRMKILAILLLGASLVGCSPSYIELEICAENEALRGNLEEAKSLHMRALEKAPDSQKELIRNNLAACYHVEGELPIAEILYKTCISNGFKESEPRLGQCLLEQDKYSESQAFLVTDKIALASSLTAEGKYSEASDLLEAIAKIDRSGLNVYNWAASLQNEGKADEILFVEAIGHAKDEDRYLPAAKNGLAKCLEGRGQHILADKLFLEAIELRRKHWPEDVNYSVQDYCEALENRGDSRLAAAIKTQYELN